MDDTCLPLDEPEGSKESYHVGFGRPPKKSRFKPGQSGNPAGRPKKPSKTPEGDRAVLERVLTERIEVRENGKAIRLTKFEAVIRQLISKAIKGDLRATKLLIERAEKLGLFERTADGEQRWGVLLVNGMAENEAEFLKRHGEKRLPTEPPDFAKQPKGN